MSPIKITMLSFLTDSMFLLLEGNFNVGLKE